MVQTYRNGDKVGKCLTNKYPSRCGQCPYLTTHEV